MSSSTLLTALTYRNYLAKEHQTTLEEICVETRKSTGIPELKLVYLDAGLPFWDGYPLFPHLSHSDGNKLDLAFLYELNGTLQNGQIPNIIGYGVFTEPRNFEKNQAEICANQGKWQYSALGKMAINWNPQLKAQNRLNHHLVRSIVTNKHVKRIFLEPHLVNRWDVQHKKVRFHGCHAVRHDDHIHIEFHDP